MPSVAGNRDYVSPGLHIVVPDAHFPGMHMGDPSTHPWKYLRREIPHLWYADHRFPLMGFVNRDEASILYNVALQFAGQEALEIGSWLGWSTCHLALAGVHVDVVDPAHLRPDVRAIAEQSIASCGVADRVALHATASPDGVEALAAERRGRPWSLLVIDGDHEPGAPARDVRACLPYAAADCAFVLHDLAAPAVAEALRVLQRAGFHVRVYQTAQIMAIAWRGAVRPVDHIPDPDVAWQLPHHLMGLPVSGVNFSADATGATTAGSALPPALPPVATSRVPHLRETERPDDATSRPSVCIVSAEIVGPFKNGGIGTAMTGLAEHLAGAGCRVTVLYTGGAWTPHLRLDHWKVRYAELGIQLVEIPTKTFPSITGPVSDHGFSAPQLVYEFLRAHPFDVVHFNDCGGDGSLCLVAKRLGLAFADTLLVVALHSPSQWVLELNRTLPNSRVLAAYNYAERLSVKCADVLWSPSQYLVDWIRRRGFELPSQTFVQQYCLPSQRLIERSHAPAVPVPTVPYGRTAAPREIVFFGRLEERKGLRLFCKAVHQLRHELAAGQITVTFLGKEETCGGMSSGLYITRWARDWAFPVKTITNLGQPEALAYMRGGSRLAVMASPVDNSPCTVYEALTWGIPFLASRTGGIPELLNEADQEHVLFDVTLPALCRALRCVLEQGAWIARPSESQDATKRVWTTFHAHARRYLPAPQLPAPPRRLVALVDGGSPADMRTTMDRLAATGAVDRVVLLNRDGVGVPLPPDGLVVHAINLPTDDDRALEDELAALGDEAVLMMHGGTGLDLDVLARMRTALEHPHVDGLQPAGLLVSGPSRRTIAPLGGDPTFTLFEGITYTGGLLVHSRALRRAALGRHLIPEAAFMGLADFCVTRGLAIWPVPEPLFVRSAIGTTGSIRANAARIAAFDDCASHDRYYMLAAGHSISTATPAWTRRAALALVRLRLGRLLRVLSRLRRRIRP